MAITHEDSPEPALLTHCRTIYAAMLKGATPHVQYKQGVETETDEVEVSGMAYEGHLTNLFADYGLSMPYYTTVKRLLEEMGCMRQLRRGGGAALSKWLLLNEPEPEAYQRASEKLAGAPKQGTNAGLKQQVNDLNNRLTRAEKTIQALVTQVMEMHNAAQQSAA